MPSSAFQALDFQVNPVNLCSKQNRAPLGKLKCLLRTFPLSTGLRAAMCSQGHLLLMVILAQSTAETSESYLWVTHFVRMGKTAPGQLKT